MNDQDDLEHRLDRLGEETTPRRPLTDEVMHAVRASESPPRRWGILRRIGIMKPVIGTAIAVGFLVFLAVSKEEPPEDRAMDRSTSAEVDSRSDANRSAEVASMSGPNRTRRWGYIDREGNVVIEPRFTVANEFHEGLAIVKVGGSLPGGERRTTIDPKDRGTIGVIDRTGTLVVEPRFDRAFHFEEGTAPVMVDGKWGFIDRGGEYVIEPRFDQAFHFREGRASVKIGEKWGFIDRKGDLVVEPVYDYVGHFSEGLGTVAVSDPDVGGWIWGFVDMNGREVIKPQYRYTGEFSEGYVAVRTEESLWGYIDRDGNQMIPYQFRSAGPFRNGLAKAELPAKPHWPGMIDKSGTMVIEPVRYYTDLGITPEGAITAYYYDPKTHEKVGVPFDPAGIWPFFGLYYSEMYFKEGRTAIQIEGSDPHRYAVVDENGNIVFTTDPDEISYVRQYSEGLAAFGIP